MFKRGIVTLMIENMDRAVKFYTETLGFKLRERYNNDWAEIEGPDLTIGLHPNKGKKLHAQGVSLGFQVKDVAEAMVALEQKGIHFQTQDAGYVKMAFFKDPDGTPLYLAQLKK